MISFPLTVRSLDAQRFDYSHLYDGLLKFMAGSGLAMPPDQCVLDYLFEAAACGAIEAIAVVVGDDTVVGILAWQLNDDEAEITMFYTLADYAGAGDALLQHFFRLTEHKAIHEVYAELPPGMSQPLFAAGFVGVERTLMAVDLTNHHWKPEPPDGFVLSGWQAGFSDDVAALMYAVNQGTLDGQIIREFRALETTAGIVQQTIAGRFGRFDRAASCLVFCGDGLAGVNLVTQRGTGSGLVAEICVARPYHRLGLARAMMHHAHAQLQACGIAQSTLGATSGNPARILYESLGYTPIGAVWSYVWPCPNEWLGKLGQNS